MFEPLCRSGRPCAVEQCLDHRGYLMILFQRGRPLKLLDMDCCDDQQHYLTLSIEEPVLTICHIVHLSDKSEGETGSSTRVPESIFVPERLKRTTSHSSMSVQLFRGC